jgi:hypothetical protein
MSHDRRANVEHELDFGNAQACGEPEQTIDRLGLWFTDLLQAEEFVQLEFERPREIRKQIQ